MKVAVIGGTGFIGSYVVEALLNDGHSPILLVQEGNEQKAPRKDECRIVTGHIADEESVRKTISGSEAVIYLIGIIREFKRKGITYEELHFSGAKECMNKAQELGVKRFLLMSANGVKPEGTGYQRTKYLSEQYMKTTDLEYTIFRPSIVYGDPKGQNRPEFCTQLRDQLIRLPLPAPLFYSGLLPNDAGKFEMSPVHVKDVSSIIVQSLSRKESIGQMYELGGPENFSWKAIIKIIGKTLDKNKWTIPAPALGIKSIAVLMDRFSFFPITRDQIKMLVEGNTCDSKDTFEMFGVEPTLFDQKSLSYLLAD